MKLFFFFLILILPLISTSQVDEFYGEWQGTGELFGNKADFIIQFHGKFDHKYLELKFQNKYQNNNGKTVVLNAHGIYKITGKDSAQGHWFDSRPMILPVKVEIAEKLLISYWGDSNSPEQGKTVYSITKPGTLTVEDFVKRGEEYSSFGKANYTKK